MVSKQYFNSIVSNENGGTNMGINLFVFSAHFVLVSNILYLVVLHKDILPEALKGEITGPLVRAIHSFAYAVFLAFCSQSTTPKNHFTRAKKGIKIGIAASFALVILSSLSPSAFQANSPMNGILLALYFTALIAGGFGDALATPALLGIIASTGEEKGPKYVGYFWTSVSTSYVYIPLLAGWFTSLPRKNPALRIIPFSFDFFLSLLAFILLSMAYNRVKRMEQSVEQPGSETVPGEPVSISDLFRTLKSCKFILASVLILAANQFAFNSLKTASQEFNGSCKHLGMAGNSLMFAVASYLVSRWWSKEKNTQENTRTWVLVSLMMILIVGFSVIMLKSSPEIGAVVMLIFGPFSAILHTGVNIYYAQVAIEQETANLGARLGMFASLYRFLGSVGYLVTTLIVFIHHIGKFPEAYLPFIAFVVNGLPILMVMIFFASITRGKDLM
jgi:MFS family permease